MCIELCRYLGFPGLSSIEGIFANLEVLIPVCDKADISI